MDGFDHYGVSPNGGRDAMLAGVWADMNTGFLVSSGIARTGTYSLRQVGSSNQRMRRLLGSNLTTVGIGFGLYLPQIPAGNNRIGVQLRDNSNVAVFTVTFQSDASIEVFRGYANTGTSLYRSGQVLTAQAWNHIEFKVFRNATTGTVELRVNGITIIDLTAQNTGSNDFASVVFGDPSSGAASGSEFYLDDIFVWDTSGSYNNDFIGPQRIYTLFPNDDTAQADWTPNSGSTGYTQLDEVQPDADTTYIEAASVNDISEFELGNLPAGVSAISAVMTQSMLRKSDAGTANVQASLLSAAAVAAGTDRPITEVYTYWPDVFETDPNTGSPWTASGFNAAKLRLEKTA
jgi:hypothetical protein